ncbi:MAG TPA: type II toxin-antitoxin system HipA family toxin [Acidiferrobacteraceae bacterium]|nr:type II toxin-antitoxin system HipA family toxin [Acidiferrobacteraceae bacterium]
MTSERECYVYIVLPGETDFVTAGRFRVSKTRDGEPIGEFVYGNRYLERQDAVEFDPIELRLTPRHYETARMGGFFGAIRDSMPDYWGRRVIVRNAGKPILDDFCYLIHGPDDRAGALGFGLNVEPPAPRINFNRGLDLEKLQQIAEAIGNDEIETFANHADARQVQELLLEGTSMGGARPKAVVEDDNNLWIAKFTSPGDKWNYPRVEYAFLQLANACGLDVADSRITTVAEKDVLLVRRFDREGTAQGYRRHRMVSALTLLRSEENPATKAEWSYLLLADEIRRASECPEADLRELFRRMCFNAVVSNLDDHPRNHAILAKDKGWRLSPAYDLTPTPGIAVEERYLAMTCGTFGRSARKANLLTGCGRFLLSDTEAEIIIDNMVKTVRGQWETTLRHAGVSNKDCIAIESACIYDGFFYELIA